MEAKEVELVERCMKEKKVWVSTLVEQAWGSRRVGMYSGCTEI